MLRRRVRVLIAAEEPRTLEVLGGVLDAHGYSTRLAACERAALRALEEEYLDAVVSDAVFEGRDIGSRLVRAARRLQPRAVVLLMSARAGAAAAPACVGACGDLTKPVDPLHLARVLHRSLREARLDLSRTDITELVDVVGSMVTRTLERVDPYTAGHGERTRRYCDLLAAKLGLDAQTRKRLELAAIAHDYGKIYLDDLGFLTHAGPLTAEEYREIQRHPTLGAEMVGRHGQLEEVARWIAEHHERWDGTGYPLGLRGEEISPPGRILGVVEVFDSLVTRRSYKDAWGLTKVLDFFQRQRGLGFDPAILDPFVGLLEREAATWLEAPLAARVASAGPALAS